MPPRYEAEPLIYQGMYHRFLAPTEPLIVPDDALSPVPITPNELGSNWEGKVPTINVTSTINGNWFGCPNAAQD